MKSATLILGLFVLCACNEAAPPDDGPLVNSNTHWLTPCESDAECGDLECHCEICTTPCDSNNACGALGGVCARDGESDAYANQCVSGDRDVQDAGVCLAPCAMDAECGLEEICQDGACTPADVACPGGLRYFCGDTIGRDGRTLFLCEGGTFNASEVCEGPCVSQADRNDVCVPECPPGQRQVCGADLGLDPNDIYSCQPGRVALLNHCAYGCIADADGPRCRVSE